MKKRNTFLLGLLVILLAMGLILSGCSDGGSGDNGNNNNSSSNSSGNNNSGNNNGSNNNSGNNGGSNNNGGNNNNSGNNNGGTGGSGVSIPGTPTGVTARALSPTIIRISWSAVSGATSYKVYYSSSYDNQNLSLNTTVTTTYYEHTSRVSDSTYYYKVAAVNSAGEGTASSIVSAKTNKFGTPGIPTDVTATAQSSSSIRISWSSPGGSYDRPTGYYIYRSTSASGSFTGLTYTTSTSYADTGLNASTTYYYYVKATNDYGDGSVSSTVSATTTASSGGGTITVPGTPTGVTASRNPAGSTTVRVSWNAVSGATGYNVYYSATGSGSGTLEGSPSTTSFDSSGNITTLTHYFRVSAVNSAGEGTPSSWVSVGPVTSGGGGGGYGTVKVENGGTSSISAIYLLLVETNGNTIENSYSTTGVDVIRTFPSVPAGKTYKVSIMIGTTTYNSNTFTLSANQTVNVMWTGVSFMIY